MMAACAGRLRLVGLCMVAVALVGLSLPAVASAPPNSTTPACVDQPAESSRVRDMLTSLMDWLTPYSSAEPREDVDCLTSETEVASEGSAASQLGIPPNRSSWREVPLNMNYTLSGLVEHKNQPSLERSTSGLQLRLSENISLLASHMDVTQELMQTVLEMSGASSEITLNERLPQELALQFGNTTLAAKADFMTGLMQYLARSLMNADVPLPESGDDVTLVFNMNDGVSGLDISTVLQQTQAEHDISTPLNIGTITVQISNGNVTSQAELDPAADAVQIKRGEFAVNYNFGSNTLTSSTAFSRGEGVEEQRFQLTAQLGSVDFTGQALFSSGLQEFKLQAFWEGLTFSTLLTPQGFQESSVGLDLEF